MAHSKTTIELNGKRYDARTGKIIGDANDVPQLTSATQKKQHSSHSGQVVDGFIRRTPSSLQNLAPKVVNTAQISSKDAKQSVSLTTAKHTKRKLSKSQTLMRPAVKKPLIAKNDIHVVKHLTKPSHAELARIARAESSAKSPLVSRYNNAASTIHKTEAHLPVVVSKAKTEAFNELQTLEHALRDATSHMHQLEKGIVHKAHVLERFGFKNKFANVSAMSFAVLLLIGFFAYQNATVISMKVAASRSGVNAQLPGYKPAGYGVAGGVKSEPGKVSVSFKSRTDDKAFTVTQQSSSWNSGTLLANEVTKTHCNTCYQTWQNDGKTVYIYDNSNATWVSGGIWYQVVGNADLTSDQLLRLANSL